MHYPLFKVGMAHTVCYCFIPP